MNTKPVPEHGKNKPNKHNTQQNSKNGKKKYSKKDIAKMLHKTGRTKAAAKWGYKENRAPVRQTTLDKSLSLNKSRGDVRS